MILGGATLEEVDALYQRMGVKELFVLPWYETNWVAVPDKPKWVENKPRLVGMITGSIEEFPEYPGLSGFLEHFIVLPEAENPLAVMQQMPKEAARLLRARGIARILLCIDHSHPKRKGLDTWARRCGYTKYAEKDGRDWYIQPLTGEQNPRHGKGRPQAPKARSASCTASPAASGS